MEILQKLLSMPKLASVEGRDIDTLMYLIHGLMLILFIGWAIYFIVVLVKFRQSKNPVVKHKDGHGEGITAVIEWAVAGFEFLLLFAFSIPFWAVNVATLPTGKDVVEVKVVGQQFAWLVHYPGPDGKFGRASAKFLDDNPLGLDKSDPDVKDDITTMNQINVPLGKTVVIRMSSKDVIHSLGIPVMRVKQDVIPGMNTFVKFTPTEVGQFEIVCSQLCGLGHYAMRGVLNVMPQEEYNQWVQEEKGNHD